MVDLSETVREAVLQNLAAEVLKSLDTEAREAVLQASIAQALGDYTFRGAVEKAVAQRAGEVAAELVREGGYDAQIRTAVQQGLDALLLQLPRAIQLALAEALCGRSGAGSYGSAAPALVLQHLKLPSKE